MNALSSIPSDILSIIVDNECRLLPGDKVSPDALMASLSKGKISKSAAMDIVNNVIKPVKAEVVAALKDAKRINIIAWMACKDELDARAHPVLREVAELESIRAAWSRYDDLLSEAIHSGCSSAPRKPSETYEAACKRLPEAAAIIASNEHSRKITTAEAMDRLYNMD